MKHDQFTRVITILTPRGHEPPDTQVAELLSTQLNVRDAAGYEHAVHASASYRDATPEEAARFWRQRCEALQGDLDSIRPGGAQAADADTIPTRREETRTLHRAVAHAVAEHREENFARYHGQEWHARVLTTEGSVKLSGSREAVDSHLAFIRRNQGG